MHFDASLVFLTWKGLGKLVCGAKPLLDSDWMVQPLVASLCAAMETKAQECVQCAPIGQEVCIHGLYGIHTHAVYYTLKHSHTHTLAHTHTHTHSHTVALIITIPQTPNSSYSKLLKVCRFLATLLVKLVRVRKPTNCHMWIGGLLFLSGV